MTWQQLVVSLVAALGAGAVGSLVAPWAQHAVASRRALQERRVALVDSWREMITHHHDRALVGVRLSGSWSEFVHEPEYLSLRPHLTDGERRHIEGDGSGAGRVEVGSYALTSDVRCLSEAVDRLEAEWKLV